MIPPGSQDRRTAGCATADVALSNVGAPKETRTDLPAPTGQPMNMDPLVPRR